MSERGERHLAEVSWRFVDARVAAGEVSVEQAIEVLIELELVRKANGILLPADRGAVWMLEPARQRLVAGPRLLLDMGSLYGGPRLYRPVSDILLGDTGAFAGPVPGPQPGCGTS